MRQLVAVQFSPHPAPLATNRPRLYIRNIFDNSVYTVAQAVCVLCGWADNYYEVTMMLLAIRLVINFAIDSFNSRSGSPNFLS